MKKSLNNYITNIIFYSFILIPISLISGPLISDVIVSLIAILFISYCLMNNEYKYFKNSFFLFLFFFTYGV